MPSKTSKSNKLNATKRSSPGRNVLLALSLVPLVIGIILIGAWVLDLEVLSDPQTQLIVGIFFFLISFTASNAIQKRWRLALGWGLLAVSDLITLAWLNVAVQIIAIVVGLVGIVILAVEFYRQYRQNKT